MNIRQLSHNLLEIYQEMSQTFSAYQTKTGWNCIPGCGKCCQNPEIEASVLEMLPMALKIFDEGKLEEWITLLSASDQSSCLALIPGKKPGEGKCSMYDVRPSVCRMFAAAGYFTKYQEVTLSICREIRLEHKIDKIPTPLEIDEVPMIAHWHLKMSSLDPGLIRDKLPLNQALLKALEKVALYSQYDEG